MATQIGLLQIIGTVHGICFYQMDGKYYARKKSSLSAERVKHDPAFAGTMRYAERMGIASKIASVLYKQLVPVGERSREKYREVVGIVIKELATDEHKGTQINHTHELHESARIEPQICLTAGRLHELARREYNLLKQCKGRRLWVRQGNSCFLRLQADKYFCCLGLKGGCGSSSIKKATCKTGGLTLLNQ